MRLRTLALAEDEALESAAWYDDRQPGLGDDFLNAYAAALDVIEQQHEQFPLMETIRSRREIRRCLLKRFPYAIVFEVRKDELVVLAVAHASRKPNYWRRRT